VLFPETHGRPTIIELLNMSWGNFSEDPFAQIGFARNGFANVDCGSPISSHRGSENIPGPKHKEEREGYWTVRVKLGTACAVPSI
jgi:hypothetical protein